MSKETNIWCENHNEFSELMKILHSKGYEWACGNSALEWDPYSQTYQDDDAGVEIEITPSKTIRYGFSNHNNNMSFTAFKIKEGIKVDNFTKADLKDGMVVCSRQGKYYMYFEKFGKFVRNTAHMDLSSYDNNLKYTNRVLGNDNRLDIMQVYEVTNLNCLDLTSQSHNFNLLWSRPEEVVMTISEIEEKLGIKNLKVVSEKEKDNG